MIIPVNICSDLDGLRNSELVLVVKKICSFLEQNIVTVHALEN